MDQSHPPGYEDHPGAPLPLTKQQKRARFTRCPDCDAKVRKGRDIDATGRVAVACLECGRKGRVRVMDVSD